LRELQDGTKVEEYEFPIILEVRTKCPSKYKLIDMETGEEYIGQRPISRKGFFWRKVIDISKKNNL
jgi:hypothetical protein